MARFVKGSAEAKEYMASIRGKKRAPTEMKIEKMKNPKKARATKGSEEAKAMMARVRSAKRK
jgi:hypothetical protein